MDRILIAFNFRRWMGVLLLMEKKDLGLIVKAIRNGQTDAFNTLYEETVRSVYWQAKTLLKNEEDSWDAVQDTYLEAFNNLDKLNDPNAVRGWLGSIVIHRCLNKQRSDKFLSGLSLDDEANVFLEPVADEQDTPGEVLDRESTQQIVGGMIDKLPEIQRITVIMFYFNEMTVAQIAEAMGCSENTVKSRLLYARKNIESQVKEEEAKTGVRLYSLSPALLLAALERMADGAPVSERIISFCGQRLAKTCGYSAALKATAAGSAGAGSAVGTGTAATTTTAAASTAGTASAYAGTAAASVAGKTAAGLGVKVAAGILAATVAVGGTAAGVTAYQRSHNPEPAAIIETAEVTPYEDVLDVASLISDPTASPEVMSGEAEPTAEPADEPTPAPTAEPTPEPTAEPASDLDGFGVSPEGARAYYNILADIVNAEGICTSAQTGYGLAYAELVDFNSDGVMELYLHHAAPDDYTDVALGEQIWYLDGDQAQLAYDNTHYTIRTDIMPGEATHHSLIEIDGETYLAVLSLGGHMGESIRTLTYYQFTGHGLNTYLTVEESFLTGTILGMSQADFKYEMEDAYGISFASDSSGSIYFSSGFVRIDGEQQEFDYTDNQLVLDLFVSGSTDPAVGEAPEGSPEWYFRRYLQQVEQSEELIYGSGYSPLEWEMNDVQAVMDYLAELSGGLPEAAPEPQAPDHSDAPAPQALIDKVRSLVSDDYNRFVLYDCNGDGQDELVTIYRVDSAWVRCEVYGLDENGNVVQMFTTGNIPEAGGPTFRMVELEYEGERHLAFRYSNYDGGLYTKYSIYTSSGNTLTTAHTLIWREGPLYTMDNSIIGLEEGKAIEDSVTVLADFDEYYPHSNGEKYDQSMTASEFIAFYG